MHLYLETYMGGEKIFFKEFNTFSLVDYIEPALQSKTPN